MSSSSTMKLRAITVGFVAAMLGCAPGATSRGEDVGHGHFEVAAPGLAAVDTSPALESAAACRGSEGESSTITAGGAEPLPARPRDSITLLAGGDVCFARELGQELLRNPDYDPFTSVRALFNAADVRFVNVESQLSDQGGETQLPNNALVFTGPPAGADALARAGIKIVSAANNHMWDYGERAFFETLANYERAGVVYAGAGRNYRKAYSPVIVEHEGFRIAVLAVTDIWNHGSLARHPAKLHIAAADADGLAATIRKLRAGGKVDAVIVSYHGGVEYLEIPLKDTRALARLVIDSGADAFLGHHPHVIQGIEVRHGRPIFYSLGNFIMNINPEQPETELGMLARLRLRRGAPPGIEVCPIRTGGLEATPLQADPAREATIAAFNERVRRVSDRLAYTPEIGPFGADGCAPVGPQVSVSRSAVGRPGASRHRKGH